MSSANDVLVAHQPSYLPWPGYFSRLMAGVDQLVLLDHVQFSERGWQNRNSVADRRGRITRLSVPVRREFGQRIDAVRIADEDWARRHWRTLAHNYSRASYWPAWSERLHEIYSSPWGRLVDLNQALIHLLLAGLGVNVQVVRSSTLKLTGSSTHMLVNLCQHTGSRVLRVGTGAGDYLDAAPLDADGITVEVVTYQPVSILAGRGNVSVLDALLHHGPQAGALVRAGTHTRLWSRPEKVDP